MHVQTQTEWEEEMSLKIINFIKSEIYTDLRYLDSALCALTPRFSEKVSSFDTDGMYLYFSPAAIIRIFKSNSRFLDRALLHTILHCLFSHPFIMQNRNRRFWNLACDISIEYTIDFIDKPCTRRALSLTRKNYYESLCNGQVSAAIIYRRLLPLSDEEISLLEKEFYTDDHNHWPKEDKKSAASQSPGEMQKKWNKLSRQTSVKKSETDTNNDEKESLLKAQLDEKKQKRSYKEFLNKFTVMHEEIKLNDDEFDLNYYSFGLSLYKNMPFIEPLESKETKKISDLVIAVDTSYSTNGDLVTNFLNETFAILHDKSNFFRKYRIHLVQCDDKIQSSLLVTERTDIAKFMEGFSLEGGGLTDFRPVFNYVNELIKNGSIKEMCGLIYFTDGKGIYPKLRPDYKTAFLFLNDYDDEKIPAWAIRMRLT